MTNFDTLFKGSERIDDNTYTVSSAKRSTLIIPKGVKVFDEGSNTWYYGDGSTAGGIEFSDAGGFSIAGDLASTATAVDWDLYDNNASALSIDTTDKTGMLNFDTRNGAEVVSTSAALTVTGAQTLTGATYANGGVDRSTAAALAIGATNANAVNISKTGVATTIKGTFNVDEAASFDTTTTVTGSLKVDGGIDRTVASGITIGGTTASTVTLSKSGAATTVAGSLTVAQGITTSSTATPFTVASNGGSNLFAFTGASGLISGVSGTYSTANGYIKILVSGIAARIPYFFAVD